MVLQCVDTLLGYIDEKEFKSVTLQSPGN
jgi:hypothetical protein